MSDRNQKLYDVSFTMVNEKEYKLIVNAMKRQVDYYRNRVYNCSNVLNQNALYNIKYNYKVYCDLYEKVLKDYDNVVKVNA